LSGLVLGRSSELDLLAGRRSVISIFDHGRRVGLNLPLPCVLRLDGVEPLHDVRRRAVLFEPEESDGKLPQIVSVGPDRQLPCPAERGGGMSPQGRHVQCC
jgi:hypothetical protein